MAEFQSKKEYGIRAEEYPYHGAKLHGHKSYGALEFNLAAEYPELARQKQISKKKRRAIPHMAAAAMCAAAVVLTAAAVTPGPAAPSPEQTVLSAPADAPTLPEPSLPEAAIPAAEHVHNYISEILRQASCTSPGILRFACACGEEYTRSVPQTEHTPQTVPAVEATCQAPGLTEGTRCSVCGEILVPQQEIAKLPHSLKRKWGVAPTCTTPGYTSEISCTECGEVLQESKTLPATNHANAISYPAVTSGICTSPGHTASLYCPDCGIWLIPRQTLPGTMHMNIVPIPAVDPTCTADGHEGGEQCADCGTILVPYKVLPSEGHVWSTEAVFDPATGTAYFVCTVCGEHNPY